MIRFAALLSRILLAAALCGGAVLSAEEVLVWQEEFAGTKLDRAKWTPEVGFVRNERAAQIYRADRISVLGGALRLTATHSSRPYPNPYLGKGNPKAWQSSRAGANYASGSVNSLGKVAVRYGRVEIRAKFNVASGAWPALWMLGSLQPPVPEGEALSFWNMITNSPWPQCGEIDILEYATRDDAGNPAQARRTVWSTFHWGDGWQGAAYKHFGKTRLFDDLDQSDFSRAPWHRYGMRWTPERITLTCDDQEVISMATADMTNPASGKSPFREHYFHFILNLALGSMANQPPDNGKGYPITFAVDYVRLWQDPTVPGSGLQLLGRERTFAHLSGPCPPLRALIPTDAREAKTGDLAITRSPIVLGGFPPAQTLKLTLALTLPARSGGTLLALCASDQDALRLHRAASGACTLLLTRAGQAPRKLATFTLPPGRHALTLAYTASGGLTLLADGTECCRLPEAPLGPDAPIRFITLGGAPSADRSPSPLRGLILHAAELTP